MFNFRNTVCERTSALCFPIGLFCDKTCYVLQRLTSKLDPPYVCIMHGIYNSQCTCMIIMHMHTWPTYALTIGRTIRLKQPSDVK